MSLVHEPQVQIERVDMPPASIEFVIPGVLAIDAECPSCYWPERTFDIVARVFGCPRCTYTSDERNA